MSNAAIDNNRSDSGGSVRLRDLAIFVRSKNAGPFMLTIDMFFDGPADCERVIKSGAITPATIAAIYKVRAETVKVIHVPPANALKVSFPRPYPAGEVGDNDVAGGQQFVPILDVMIP
jgi:hypothetical protein